jgi:L-lactate dehydrogenase
VHAYIIGEHGDSEVPVWSLANVAGMRLDELCRREECQLPIPVREQIFYQARDAAYEILQGKGATYYGVSAAMLRIVESILRDQHTVLSVSSLVPSYYGLENIYLSLPAVIDRAGVERVLHLPLDKTEKEALRESAQVLRGVLDDLGD